MLDHHYHAPPHSEILEAVLDIDRQLAEIDRSFDLLLQATPVNAEGAWREFRRSRFEKPPIFYYRPLAVDPTLLKRQLYLIPVEREIFTQLMPVRGDQAVLLVPPCTSRTLVLAISQLHRDPQAPGGTRSRPGVVRTTHL